MITMEKERLKLIVKNLKSLVAALESEVYSDVKKRIHMKTIKDIRWIMMRSLKTMMVTPTDFYDC